jgi:hypothetical protein
MLWLLNNTVSAAALTGTERYFWTKSIHIRMKSVAAYFENNRMDSLEIHKYRSEQTKTIGTSSKQACSIADMWSFSSYYNWFLRVAECDSNAEHVVRRDTEHAQPGPAGSDPPWWRSLHMRCCQCERGDSQRTSEPQGAMWVHSSCLMTWHC